MKSKQISIVLLGLILLFLTTPLLSQPDNKIRVKGIVMSGADSSRANFLYNKLLSDWNGAGLNPSPPVSLELAGLVSSSQSVAGTGPSQQFLIDLIISNAGTGPLSRGTADLVVAFVGSIASRNGLTTCGYGGTPYWQTDENTGLPMNPKYLPFDPFATDLRGSEEGYIAVISTNTACEGHNQSDRIVMHEIGHLLGGGHDKIPSNWPHATQPWLFNNSLAVDKFTYGPFGSITIGHNTILAGFLNPPLCNSAAYCLDHNRYSTDTGNTNIGDSNHDNVSTINVTAWSVANYRPILASGGTGGGNGGQQCSLSIPFNLNAVLDEFCALTNQGYATTYNLDWDDNCPTATVIYIVEGKIPDIPSSPWFTATVSASTATTIGVQGTPGTAGRVRVRACSDIFGINCSLPSNSVQVYPFC